MRIVFEKGQYNWYATAENCDPLYRGLLVVGGSIEAVIDKLPGAFRELREAAARAGGMSMEQAAAENFGLTVDDLE